MVGLLLGSYMVIYLGDIMNEFILSLNYLT